MRRRVQELLRQLRENWPAPDDDALAVGSRLVERIEAEIDAAGGSVGFDRYMEMALYQPGLGYYSAGLAKFGAGGDFITAPLISSLFSRTLARQSAEVLSALGGGDILELGAGSGRMAADILAELAALDCLPGRYRILELSATLRQQQRETLAAQVPELLPRVDWLEALPETPLEGVILANEVLDALPVERFEIDADGGVAELRVARGEQGFEWQREPAPAPLAQAVAALGRPLPPGYSSELCLRLPPWVGGVAGALGRGVAIFIDYGYPRAEYYHPQRHSGTLMCHYRHRAHPDPLILPGLQDITAFVDFTAVAEAGIDAGLELLGYAPQASFLFAAGLPALFEAAAAGADEREHLRLTQQVKQLTLPGEMGERFKVMAFGRDYEAPLSGFLLQDHRDRL